MATGAEPLGRPAWTGAITFGLVAVPVRLYPATVSHHGPVLHQVHREDGSRVRQRRYCELENREVSLDEIAKGADVDGGTVVLTDEDLDDLLLPSAHTIDVHAFIPESDINGLSWDSPYYVGLGDKAPTKPYVLLARALRESGQVAVTRIAMRTRESLAILRERDGLLILQTVKWPDEIRPTAGIRAPSAEDEPVHANEIKMALQLAEGIGRGFDLDAERDQYVVALEQLLEAKVTGGEAPHAPEAAPAAAPALDLMAALQASISETQAKRDEAAKPAKKPAAKKTAAKKAPAKRTPRKAG